MNKSRAREAREAIRVDPLRFSRPHRSPYASLGLSSQPTMATSSSQPYYSHSFSQPQRAFAGSGGGLPSHHDSSFSFSQPQRICPGPGEAMEDGSFPASQPQRWDSFAAPPYAHCQVGPQLSQSPHPHYRRTERSVMTQQSRATAGMDFLSAVAENSHLDTNVHLEACGAGATDKNSDANVKALALVKVIIMGSEVVADAAAQLRALFPEVSALLAPVTDGVTRQGTLPAVTNADIALVESALAALEPSRAAADPETPVAAATDPETPVAAADLADKENPRKPSQHSSSSQSSRLSQRNSQSISEDSYYEDWDDDEPVKAPEAAPIPVASTHLQKTPKKKCPRSMDECGDDEV
ncbi:hypothetical protein BV898_03605 [Hypsibius exemplaris]|uniref:Uncharacterized protein n=1 Tax=Hypsibius exemplaris TaxID=2072580 RepID=A0A1W0X4Y7_HYPEX|nr:hypothetical protein BV898_03605 [Hypsibius exemplaris]